MARLSWPTRLYVGVLALGALATVGLMATRTAGATATVNLLVAAEFVALAVVANHFPLEFARQRKVHASLGAQFALVLYAGPSLGIPLVGLAALLGQTTLLLRGRRGLLGLLFNTSQAVLAAAAAGACL